MIRVDDLSDCEPEILTGRRSESLAGYCQTELCGHAIQIDPPTLDKHPGRRTDLRRKAAAGIPANGSAAEAALCRERAYEARGVNRPIAIRDAAAQRGAGAEPNSFGRVVFETNGRSKHDASLDRMIIIFVAGD
jgi:hypothetical protein